MIARRPLYFAAAGALVYITTFAYRLDAAGHFCAGFGGTLFLLALVSRGRSELGWSAIFAALAAIGIGIVAELTVFSDLVADPVDVANQSLGALLATACVLARPVRSGALAVTALPILLVGFVFAFA